MILLFSTTVLWVLLSVANAQYYASTSGLLSSGCIQRYNYRGVIRSEELLSTEIQKCWSLVVPDGKYVRLSLLKLQDYNTVTQFRIRSVGENDALLRANDRNKPITRFSDVEIHLNTNKNNRGAYHQYYHFELSYLIEDILCLKNNSFRCTDHSCIHDYQVCDGNTDCESGQDEYDCDNVIRPIEGVNVSRLGAIDWLKRERVLSGIWRRNGARAVTALYLAEGVDSNDTCNEDNMFAKEIELKTSVALLRNGTDPLTPNDLGMLIHALLVTCHNPRSFYGFDLVSILKEKVEERHEDIHPFASLALCNANETLSNRQVKKIQRILHSDSTHPFLVDVQAVALMALSCIRNSGMHHDVESSLNSTIHRFLELQQEDGSFGNIYTTALVSQALLGSGQEGNAQWRAKETIHYLLNQQSNNSSFGDFLATYLVLPILNAKSLVDIATFDCSQNHRKSRDDAVSEIEQRLGQKTHVQYSLYIGDELDVVHSITLRVPLNLTAYEVMEVAASVDPKYKFKSHVTTGNKIYVYSVDETANDPEAGKFWLLYLQRDPPNGTLHLVTESPDQMTIQEGEKIIMWFKSANV